MQIAGRKLRLERHRYAPELNTLWVGSTPLKVPGSISIHGAIKHLGWVPVEPRRMVEVRVVYPAEWASLNREHIGWVHNYQHIKLVLDRVRAHHCSGDRKLLDGRTLPVPEIHVHTWLEG